ncbi:MAG: DnaJ domain-containing protein [Gammaproteobacteria bacterium]|nr:DnaJ domain-containing protein [Gammaproteobacteria bacterium]
MTSMRHTQTNLLRSQCELLGVTAGSTWQDVQVAYRTLVQQCHPDRHAGQSKLDAQDRFIEVNSAYTDLKRHYREYGALPIFSAHVECDTPLFKERERDRVPSDIRLKLKIAAAVVLAITAVTVALWKLDADLVKQHKNTADAARAAYHSAKTTPENTPLYHGRFNFSAD